MIHLGMFAIFNRNRIFSETQYVCAATDEYK